MVHPFATENIWFDASRVWEAESNFYARKYCGASATSVSTNTGIASDIQKIKDHIRGALGGDQPLSAQEMQRLEALEKENDALKALINKLEARVSALEVGGKAPAAAPAAAAPARNAAADDDDDDDDDVDLFGSDEEEETEEQKKVREERLAAYASKKSKKPVLIAKSNIVLDVKPWDDETDMAELEKNVRSIKMDGLLWGAGKLVAVGYGIKKLQICCVVEDDKVMMDDLEEKITDFDDFVQSVDIAAFNKI